MSATAYTPELAAQICVQLVEGKSLRSICKQEGMPGKSTVFDWLRTNPDFLKLYTVAREDQADALADEIIEIADEAGATKGALNKAKLKIDARKWVAGKLRPKKYGDRVTQEHTGPDGGPVQFARIERVIVRPADPDA